MKRTAFLFPGQGAQYIGMGKDFYDSFPESRVVFEQADDLLGFSLTKMIFEQNEQLNVTEYTQAAMITTIAAMLAHIDTMSIQPEVCAGLSLGEYAALVQSRVLTAVEAIGLVRKRGIYMQEAVPQGLGKMAAVLGMDNSVVESICEAVHGIVTVANYNCPGQVVISGEKDAVDLAAEALIKANAKRVVELKVSGPFHSPMLRGAGEKLLKELDQVTLHDPVIPYVANVTADYVMQKAPIRKLLADQVSSPVRWQQSVERMIADGIEVFVEVGPGKTLSSFVKKMDRTKTVINIDKTEDLDKLKDLV